MLHSLLGAALWRSLEKLIAPPPQGGPDPHIEIAPEQEVTAPQSTRPAGPAMVYPTVERNAMGSLFQVFLCGDDRSFLTSVGEEAMDEVVRLEHQLSHLDPESDVSRLNEHAPHGWVRLEPRLFSLLQDCIGLCRAGDGAFDITSASLANAWGIGGPHPAVPRSDEIAACLGAMGPAALELDADEQQVTFANPRTRVSLAAIGKGYAIDRAMQVLELYGIGTAVVHGGKSSIGVVGAGPSGEGWDLAIRDPGNPDRVLQTIRATDQSISTSGVSEQWFEQDGVRYGHILDPRTGYPVGGRHSVTVVAPTGAEAEALSTACFVLGPDAAAPLLAARPGVTAVFLEGAPGSIDVITVGRGAA